MKQSPLNNLIVKLTLTLDLFGLRCSYFSSLFVTDRFQNSNSNPCCFAFDPATGAIYM
ncbi:hypothetical protein Hanom_Chr03g00250231 [Helianthus anomalus]